jgi:RNA recognition motif. (a.k.a. RRM, RBD, or RNP domain)
MARVDRSDEGFVNCGACGADVLVALSSFARDGEASVRCIECGNRWVAGAASVLMLDGSANLVSAVEARRPGDGPVLMQRVKLFVGGLSPKVTKETLAEAFEEFGDVTDASIAFDKVTGRSRGFGFVTLVRFVSSHLPKGCNLLVTPLTHIFSNLLSFMHSISRQTLAPQRQQLASCMSHPLSEAVGSLSDQRSRSAPCTQDA